MMEITLDHSYKFVILACDGLWDVCDHSQACAFVDDALNRGLTPKEVAQDLTNYALEKGSSDNVTVVIIKLDWKNASTMDTGKHTMKESVHVESDVVTALPLQVPTIPSQKPKAPIVLKNLHGVHLRSSYFYLNEAQDNFCVQKLGFLPDLPCWVSQELISEKLFGESGVTSLKQAEKHAGKFFLWATEFSNVHTTFTFIENPIIVKGIEYPGAEQYFQIQKSVNTNDQQRAFEELRIATPEQAFSLGRKFQLRPDWEDIKESVMLEALEAKFTQNRRLRDLLLATGDHTLVQLKTSDGYWGTGNDGTGRNRQAVLVMEVRKKLRED